MPVFMLLLAATANLSPSTDVASQIRAGKLLCSNPDPATKTCSTIDSFTTQRDGSFTDIGEVLLSPDEPLTLQISSVIHLEKGAMCGVMDLADLQRATIRDNGTPIPVDRNAMALTQMAEQVKPMAGSKVCETLRIEDGRLIKDGKVEGKDIDLPAKPVSWIMPADGYKVAPPR